MRVGGVRALPSARCWHTAAARWSCVCSTAGIQTAGIQIPVAVLLMKAVRVSALPQHRCLNAAQARPAWPWWQRATGCCRPSLPPSTRAPRRRLLHRLFSGSSQVRCLGQSLELALQTFFKRKHSNPRSQEHEWRSAQHAGHWRCPAARPLLLAAALPPAQFKRRLTGAPCHPHLLPRSRHCSGLHLHHPVRPREHRHHSGAVPGGQRPALPPLLPRPAAAALLQVRSKPARIPLLCPILSLHTPGHVHVRGVWRNAWDKGRLNS